jgi:tetratricopeptide (TPR) repeat protein
VSHALALALVAGVIAAAPISAQPPPVALPRPAGVTDSGARTLPDSATLRRALGDTALIPPEDQARGVDAEVRAALFQLMNGAPIPALSRLQWLVESPVALGAASDATTLRTRENLLFLLAEAYYTLGMDEGFRATARQLIGPIPASSPTTTAGGPATAALAVAAPPAGVSAGAAPDAASRFAPILRVQLMLDAYRRGDFAAAIQLSRAIDNNTAARPLAALIAGLVEYQMGRYTEARAAFASAAGGGGPYADYGRYMDALAQLRSDTANAAPAFAALNSLATSAQGDFGHQVRLTAAQLAYEMEQYPAAVQLASAIPATSGLGAQALFTRAWSQYKADQIEPSGESFLEFATRYPDLPEREEARLMHGQALLQLGRTEQAATVFRSVADTAMAMATGLQARTRSAMTDAARALVQARAAGLLFIRDPASGKTIALQDGAGAESAILASIFTDSIPTVPSVTAPEVVALDDVTARLATVGPAMRRVVFAPTSATRSAADFVVGAQRLYEADIAVALARYRLDEQMLAQQRHLALLRRFQEILGGEMGAFDTLATGLQAAHDSLARVTEALGAAGTRLTQMFMAQVATLRLLADENVAALDSLVTGLRGAIAPADETVIMHERQTALAYRGVADLVENGLAGAIRRHPIFALGDSLARRGERAAALLAEARRAAEETRRILAQAIVDAENMETDRVRGLRSTLASAETRLGDAETRLVGIVETELRARAGEVVALLQRDTEAAEFGSASALFFQTLDAEQRPAGAPVGAPTSGGPGSSASTTTNRPVGADPVRSRPPAPASIPPRR